MRNAFLKAWTAICIIQAVGFGQTAPTKSVLGAVASFNRETRIIDVKPDNAAAVTVKLLPTAAIQRIAPGETSLANAATVTASEIMTGDRVLVTLASNGTDGLRVVIISAGDIAKRDEADRQDWTRRGISGIVAAKNGNQVLLRMRTPR